MYRTPFFAAIALGMSLAAMGCFRPSQVAWATPPPQTVNLQLSWHHQFQFAGYYLAEILGYYEQEGLQVNILAGLPGTSAAEEVLAGRAQFGIGNTNLLVQYIQGRPLLALAAVSQHAPIVLIALERSGIRHMGDLAGKRVMLQPGYGSLPLLAMLQQTDMLEKIQRIDSSMQIEDLLNGTTDLFNASLANEPYLLQQQGIGYHVINPKDYGINFYSDILFTTQRFYQEQRAVALAFRSASLRGWRYAMVHPEKTIDLISQFYPIDKDKAWLRYEANEMREQILPDLVEIGYMSRLRWEQIAEQLGLIGITSDAGVDLDAFIDQPNEIRTDWESLYPYAVMMLLLFIAAMSGLILLVTFNRNLRKEVRIRMQAEQRATHLATHDALTGLPNRILFMDRLEKTLQRARREHRTPGLLFFDLDNFKAINDNYGHYRGDEALKRVAAGVNKVIRESDTFARLGGDEFTLLVDDCDDGQFHAFATKVLTAVQQALNTLHTGMDLGASIGLLVVKDPLKDAETVLLQADHLMYRAKFSGKNRIEAGTI